MTDPRSAALVLSAVALCGCAAAEPRPVRAPSSRQTAQEAAGMRYLLHLPASYSTRTSWPLVLFLHGGGERGFDLDLVRREGLPRMLESLPDFPFVVVSPQEERRYGWSIDALGALLDEIVRTRQVDPERIYLTGLSSGAVAALELAIDRPGEIAAVVPISPNVIPGDLCRMKDVPAWIFHSAGDERIPFGRAEKLARALEACGGRTNVQLTIYAKRDHDAWTDAYASPALWEWLRKHRRARPRGSS